MNLNAIYTHPVGRPALSLTFQNILSSFLHMLNRSEMGQIQKTQAEYHTNVTTQFRTSYFSWKGLTMTV